MPRQPANADLRKIANHRFRLGRYRLKWVNPGNGNDGLCDAPTTRGKTINVNPGLTGKRLLEVLLDESLHAGCWELDNDAVAEMADTMADFLWRCGYRRLPEVEPKV